jgi:hypothetical protein
MPLTRYFIYLCYECGSASQAENAGSISVARSKERE